MGLALRLASIDIPDYPVRRQAVVKTETPVKILLVDDIPANLLSLEAVLDNPGLSLTRANSGQEALNHLTQGDFAVVLMDVRMPVMDGIETAASIRKTDPDGNMPIIFLTAAQNNDIDKARAYAVGAIDYLLKPYVPSELRTKVAILSDLFREKKELVVHIDYLNNRVRELEKRNSMLKEEKAK
jgi:CheY-like chemotaxis protein